MTSAAEVEVAPRVEKSEPREEKSEHDEPKEQHKQKIKGEENNIARRIVSPELPQLSEEMKTTIQISQRIQQEQQCLIATRKNKEGPRSAGATSTRTQPQTVHLDTPSDELTEQETEKLKDPRRTKRLKRRHVPSPLRVGDKSSGYKVIKSAPLRQERLTPGVARRFPAMLQQHPYDHSFPYESNQPYHIATKRPRPPMGPTEHVSACCMYTPSYQGPIRVVPRSAICRQFPAVPGVAKLVTPATTTNMVFSTARSSNWPSHSQKSGSAAVTDVYEGDYTKPAPLSSQPLSAQCEYFDASVSSSSDSNDYYDMDAERPPASALSFRRDSDNSKDSNDVESAALSEEEIQRAPDHHKHFYRSQGYPITGLINFMDQSVFRFKIFDHSKNKEKSSLPLDVCSREDSTLKKGSPEKASAERVSQENVSQERASLEDEHSWTMNENKKKFLKICETSWDRFMSS